MENDSYKFDGTIDSGNSGGGAFDSSGKLIGIPYAVRSENGMIGYIIPLTTVNDFLAGKTDNIEEYSGDVPLTFTNYIKKIQALYRDTNLLQTKNIISKDLNKNFKQKQGHSPQLIQPQISNAIKIFHLYIFKPCHCECLSQT